jgi:GNAT superfamily N-acetyltransferase
MRVVRWDPADTAALRGCEAVWGAALDIDDPDGPRMTGQVLAAYLRHGFTSDPAETWFIPGTAPGSVTGWYRLELPDLENRDRAELLIVIDPAARRQGLATGLLRHAAERAAAVGRASGEVRRAARGRGGGRRGIFAGALDGADARRIPRRAGERG